MAGCRAVDICKKTDLRNLRDVLNGESVGAKILAEGLFPLPICVIMEWVMQMDKEKELPKRKELRLKQYDYSSAGAYFVTICIKDRKRILSDIIKPVGVDVLGDPS